MPQWMLVIIHFENKLTNGDINDRSHRTAVTLDVEPRGTDFRSQAVEQLSWVFLAFVPECWSNTFK